MEKMTVEQIAEAIENIGGFDYDWTMTWGENQEETNGEGDWENLEDEDARQSAKEYEKEVMAASSEAAEYERQAAESLRAGDLQGGLRAMEAAAKQERQFGDDPTYSHLRKQLEARIEELTCEDCGRFGLTEGIRHCDVCGQDVQALICSCGSWFAPGHEC